MSSLCSFRSATPISATGIRKTNLNIFFRKETRKGRTEGNVREERCKL
uniref:Uncharacterized protein n=1 Tax=Nelumbo nucifera TaxID=4432 RepID=A0A822Y6H2_NELNU|nr:TPA_asm: hypothetical protein HUJ06_029091 [Nelumbo nucifera]